MNAAIPGAAILPESQMRSRLDQAREQSASLDLHDAGRHRFDIARYKVVGIAEISDGDRAGWSIVAVDVQRRRRHPEIAPGFKVMDERTKLMIAARSAEEFYPGTVA